VERRRKVESTESKVKVPGIAGRNTIAIAGPAIVIALLLAAFSFGFPAHGWEVTEPGRQGAADATYNSTTTTVNWSSAPVQVLTMTGNITTVAFTGGANGGRYTLYVCQGGAGSFTVTNWPSTIKWFDGGTAPTLTTTTGHCDAVVCQYLSGSTSYPYKCGVVSDVTW
jgi:hypothetical protein